MKTLHLLRNLLAALALLAVLPSLPAATIVDSFDDITYWVGSGSNRAALVIDWADGTSEHSFAWGYRWNGTTTGEDMLRAISGFIGTDEVPAAPNPGGDPALTLYTKSFDFGIAVHQLEYLGHAQGGFDVESSGYWAYYVGNGTDTLPAEWNFSEVGMGDRELANNDWDGWSWQPDFTGDVPSQPVAAVPEPGIVALFTLGASALLCYRRGRNA